MSVFDELKFEANRPVIIKDMINEPVGKFLFELRKVVIVMLASGKAAQIDDLLIDAVMSFSGSVFLSVSRDKAQQLALLRDLNEVLLATIQAFEQSLDQPDPEADNGFCATDKITVFDVPLRAGFL